MVAFGGADVPTGYLEGRRAPKMRPAPVAFNAPSSTAMARVPLSRPSLPMRRSAAKFVILAFT